MCRADESDELVETVAKGVGKTNTMIWQYVPAFVLLAKFAEVSARTRSRATATERTRARQAMNDSLPFFDLEKDKKNIENLGESLSGLCDSLSSAERARDSLTKLVFKEKEHLKEGVVVIVKNSTLPTIGEQGIIEGIDQIRGAKLFRVRHYRVSGDEHGDAEEGDSERRRCCGKAEAQSPKTPMFEPVQADNSPGDELEFDLERGADEKTLNLPKAWTKEDSKLEVSKDTHDYFATDIGIPQSESDTASEREADEETPIEAAEALKASAESRFNLWFAWGIALYECE